MFKTVAGALTNNYNNMGSTNKAIIYVPKLKV